jgi:alpha-L-fucosidase 2
MKFVARLRAIPQWWQGVGRGRHAAVDSADEVVLLVAAATDYQGFAGRNTDPIKATDDIARASAKSYEQLRSAHVADYRGYFDRVSMTLDDGKPRAAPPPRCRPTSGWRRCRGQADPALAALYFNFGRTC